MKSSLLSSNPKLPKHIGFIIDGNGRWALKRGLSRSKGHKAGFENLKKHIEFVKELGIKNLSVFCFSKENWNRPQEEVNYLMELFNKVLDDFFKEYTAEDKDIRIIISGDMDDERLPLEIRNKAKDIMELTKHKTGFIINPCINYGGRQEIVNAVNNIIKNKETCINEQTFEKYLYTKEQPKAVQCKISVCFSSILNNFYPVISHISLR